MKAHERTAALLRNDIKGKDLKIIRLEDKIAQLNALVNDILAIAENQGMALTAERAITFSRTAGAKAIEANARADSAAADDAHAARSRSSASRRNSARSLRPPRLEPRARCASLP